MEIGEKVRNGLVEEPKKTFENAVEENFVDLVK
jgi:hypothetical protein